MPLWEDPELERQINDVGRRFDRKMANKIILLALLLAAVIAVVMILNPDEPWVRWVFYLIPGLQPQEVD